MSPGAFASALVIPPLNLLLLGLAGVVFSRYRLGRIAAGVAICGLYILALPLTSVLLLNSLEAGLPDTAPQPRDAADPPAAIVILGGDRLFGDATGGIMPGVDLGEFTVDRLRAGALLHKRTGLPVLVTGGGLGPGPTALANRMAQVLEDEFATPVRWIEPKSANTWENGEFSAALLRADGIRSVYVVTNGWHMRRALLAFAHFGIDASPAPLRIVRTPRYVFAELLPTITALRASSVAMHEWIGYAYYVLRAYRA